MGKITVSQNECTNKKMYMKKAIFCASGTFRTNFTQNVSDGYEIGKLAIIDQYWGYNTVTGF